MSQNGAVTQAADDCMRRKFSSTIMNKEGLSIAKSTRSTSAAGVCQFIDSWRHAGPDSVKMGRDLCGTAPPEELRTRIRSPEQCRLREALLRTAAEPRQDMIRSPQTAHASRGKTIDHLMDKGASARDKLASPRP